MGGMSDDPSPANDELPVDPRMAVSEPEGLLLAEACPDGPRYKALGNSMAVPVMAWIGERIEMVERILIEGAAA